MTPRSVRVLWVIKGLGPGGAERLLVEMANASDPAEISYEAAYLLPWKDHLVPVLEAAGVRTHCIDGGDPWDVRWVVRLRRIVGAGGFDVVHTHSPAVAPFVRAVVRSLPRVRRPRLAYTEHNAWHSYAVPTRWLNAATFGLDDVQFAVSDSVRESVSRRRRSRVQTVVHGIDTERVWARRDEREDARAELGVASDEVLVGTVANLRADKDYPNLLRAARIVLTDCPGVRFMAAGHGPLESEIRRLHADLDLGDRFRLLGYVADAVRFLAACDVFVLASRNEGLPVVLMEAGALGLPIVATSVGGVPSAVGLLGTGILVDAARPADLAAALIEACRPRSRSTVPSHAVDAAQMFSARTAASEIRAAYERCF